MYLCTYHGMTTSNKRIMCLETIMNFKIEVKSVKKYRYRYQSILQDFQISWYYYIRYYSW